MAGVAVPLLGSLPHAGAAADAGCPAAEQTGRGRQPMDEAAFRAFYDRTARGLRSYLARVSGDRALADDLLQEAFLRLLRSGFVGSSEAHTKNYLFRIGTNLLRDHFRRPRREMPGLPDSLPARETGGEVELRADFQAAFGALSPRERAMLWLAYVEGWSHQEIAPLLRVRPASLKALLFRARSRLARLLRAKGLAPTGPAGGAR